MQRLKFDGGFPMLETMPGSAPSPSPAPAPGPAPSVIDDRATFGAARTWSIDGITAAMTASRLAVRDELTGGASDALDTLAALAHALGDDGNFAATVTAALAARVQFDAAQVLTYTQLEQLWLNTHLGNPAADPVAAYTTAKS